jgi:hypothetical protein
LRRFDEGPVRSPDWRSRAADVAPDLEGAADERAVYGQVNVDIRDAVPDWPPRAPERAASVVFVVLDDVGFSAMSSYGGPIETPNIDRIVGDGVRYTQFRTTALCSPPRGGTPTWSANE